MLDDRSEAILTMLMWSEDLKGWGRREKES